MQAKQESKDKPERANWYLYCLILNISNLDVHDLKKLAPFPQSSTYP
jgi:hypothetical protein